MLVDTLADWSVLGNGNPYRLVIRKSVYERKRQLLLAGTEKNNNEEQCADLESGEGVTARCCNQKAPRFLVTNRLGVCRPWAILGLEVFTTQGLRTATFLPTNQIIDYRPALVTSSAGSRKSCPRLI